MCPGHHPPHRIITQRIWNRYADSHIGCKYPAQKLGRDYQQLIVTATTDSTYQCPDLSQLSHLGTSGTKSHKYLYICILSVPTGGTVGTEIKIKGRADHESQPFQSFCLLDITVTGFPQLCKQISDIKQCMRVVL